MMEAPIVDNQEPVLVEEQPSGLPSDVESQPEAFAIKEDALTDGKFMGKWSSPEEMADHIKNMEDKYANLSRDISDKEKQQESTQEEQQAQEEKQSIQHSTIMELAPEFIDTGVLSDEMMERLKGVGLDEKDIKAGAYEVKQTLDKHTSYVGGKENYDIIMDYHASTMSDDEKRAFNHTIQDPKHAEALLVGLQTLYERSEKASQPTTRISGEITPSSATRPYEDRASLFRDRSYIQSPRGKTDKAAIAQYNKRIAITDSKVYM